MGDGSTHVIELILRTQDQMSRGIDQATAHLRSFGEKAAEVGAQMRAVSLPMLALGGAALAGIGAATKVAGDYQAALTELVTGAGETKSALGMVSQGILDMAGQVGVLPTELAAGLYPIESAGFRAAAGLEVLKESAIAARVGSADMATVADAVTTALNAYGAGADQARTVTDVLLTSVQQGKMHFGDLASSLGRVLPAAASANVSLAEVGAAMSTMTARGVPAQEAAGYLRSALLMLQNPATTAQAAMRSIGLTSQEVGAVLTGQGLLPALQLVQTHLDQHLPRGTAVANAALTQLFGGIESGQAGMLLMNGNLSTFANNVASVRAATEGAGATMKGWGEAQQDAKTQSAQLAAATQGMSIAIGNAFLPVLQRVEGAIAPIIQRMTQWAAAHPDLVAKIGLLTAGGLLLVGGLLLISSTVMGIIAIIAGLASVIGAVAVAIGGALAPIAVPLVGLIAIVGALYVAWSQNWGGMQGIVASVGNWLQGALQTMLGWLNNMIVALGGTGIEWGATWEGMKKTAANAVGGLGGIMGNAGKSLVDMLGLGGLGSSTFGQDSLKQMMANQFNLPSGALMNSGTPAGTDIVPILDATGSTMKELASAAQTAIGGIGSMAQSASDASIALGKMPGLQGMKPGENGPYEPLFRIQDVAQNLGIKDRPESKGQGPIETNKWASTLVDQAGIKLADAAATAGMSLQAYAKDVTLLFQERQFTNPEVARWVDTDKLTSMLTTQYQGEIQTRQFGEQQFGNNPDLLALYFKSQGLSATAGQVSQIADAAKDGTLQNLITGTAAVATAVTTAVNTGSGNIVQAINAKWNAQTPYTPTSSIPQVPGWMQGQFKAPPAVVAGFSVAQQVGPAPGFMQDQFAALASGASGGATGAAASSVIASFLATQGGVNKPTASTTIQAPAAASPTMTISVNVNDGAVKIGGEDPGGRGKSFGSLVAETLKKLAEAEARMSVGASVGLPGMR
jgi:TP901 family phage tail tape measure protein